MGTVILVGGMIAVVLAVILRAVAGKTGYFRINGQALELRSWRLRLSVTPIDTTSFITEGWSTFLPGFLTGEVSGQGFWNPATPIPIGEIVAVNLGLGGGYGLATTVTVLDFTMSTAVDRAAEVEISGRTNGAFTVVPVLG